MAPVPAPCSALADEVAALEAEERSLRAALPNLSGFAVWATDEIEHNSIVIEVIRKQIGQCDIVIGEVSEPNVNVYYEVGYAHALEKPTILLARAATELPFDTQQFNHIFYVSIVDLRDRLTKRLVATASDIATA